MKREGIRFGRGTLASGWCVAAGAALALAGCSGESAPAVPAATGGGGAGGSAPAPVDLTISVQEGASRVERGHYVRSRPVGAMFGDNPALPGATVLIELPDGSQFERTSDASGEVVLEEVDRSAGKIRFSAHKAGYGGCSDEFPEGRTEWPAVLVPLEPLDVVTVSGTVHNIADGAEEFQVEASTAASAEGVYGTEAEPGYSIDLVAERPFSLVLNQHTYPPVPCPRCHSLSILGWKQVDRSAPSDAEPLDIDLADAAPGVITRGTIRLPEEEDSVLGREGYVWLYVSSHRGRTVHGWMLLSQLHDDARGFEIRTEHYVMAGADDVTSTYGLFSHQGRGIRSYLTRAGYPQDQASVSGFLDAPTVVSPQDEEAYLTLADAIEWIPLEPTDAAMFLTRDGRLLWQVYARDGASRLVLPELPSSVDRDELFGRASLDAEVLLLRDRPTEEQPTWGRLLRLLGLRLWP